MRLIKEWNFFFWFWCQWEAGKDVNGHPVLVLQWVSNCWVCQATLALVPSRISANKYMKRYCIVIGLCNFSALWLRKTKLSSSIPPRSTLLSCSCTSDRCVGAKKWAFVIESVITSLLFPCRASISHACIIVIIWQQPALRSASLVQWSILSMVWFTRQMKFFSFLGLISKNCLYHDFINDSVR